jgi:hypothetical protein
VNPITDADIQAELMSLISSNGWKSGMNNEFFVFLGRGVQVCKNSFNCTFPSLTDFHRTHPNEHPTAPDLENTGVFCAYHDDFTIKGGNHVLYAVMPDDDSLDFGCNLDITLSPNSLISADREIGFISQELQESLSDPFGGTSDL